VANPYWLVSGDPYGALSSVIICIIIITENLKSLLLLLLTANGFSPGGSGTTIRQQTKYKLTTIRQHTI
jgi:hypothetical protein